VQVQPPPAPRPPVVYAPAQPYPPPGYRPPPPVVVYQPPPPVMIVRPEAPPPYVYRRPVPMAVAPRHEWGLNLHVEGAMIGHGLNGNAGMGGAGFGLRYKPSPYFGMEADLDFVGGNDWTGNGRTETAFTMNGLVFLNPRSRAQVYLLGGFGWSAAHLSDGCSSSSSGFYANYCVDSYSYFGGQAGVGLELRLSRHLALNADLRGFIRGRIDGAADIHPEFRNSSGQTTNTSGGGLLTAGMTFYF